MRWPDAKRVLVLRSSTASGRHVSAVARWARALVPAAVLIVTPFDDSEVEPTKNSIVLDAGDVSSGPLALADAITRAVAASPEDIER